MLTTVILKSAMHFTTITTKKNKKKDWTFLLWQQTQLKQIQIEKRKIHATKQNENSCKKINVLWLLAMTISMVVSLYEYPTFATPGFSLVFFLLLGGLLWFIPGIVRSRDGNGERMGKRRCLYLSVAHWENDSVLPQSFPMV